VGGRRPRSECRGQIKNILDMHGRAHLMTSKTDIAKDGPRSLSVRQNSRDIERIDVGFVSTTLPPSLDGSEWMGMSSGRTISRGSV